MRSPRHPEVHVALHSRNPFAWVSSVRHALRQSGVAREEISRFSAAALTHQGNPDETWQIVSAWVNVVLL